MKYLSNFWRSLNLPLINCEVELDLSWEKESILAEHNNNIAGIDFRITSTKLYVPVDALPKNDDINFLDNIKQRFKICWNK